MKKLTTLAFMLFSFNVFAQDEFSENITDDMITEAAAQVAPADEISDAKDTVPENATCGKTKIDGDKFGWCIHSTDRTKNPFVVYHFHGLNGSEKKWSNNYTKDLINRWKAQGYTQPTAVTISFGRLWLLTETSHGHRYRLFIDKIIPFLESKIGNVLPSQRLLVGESMGGFNTSQILFKNPELFSRFALHCPAVTDVGPYDSDNFFKAFIKRTGALFILAYFTKLVGLSAFRNNEEWERHAPVLLSERAGRIPAKVFMSCGDKDEFGFDEGTFDVADNIKNKTKEFKLRYIPGGHHMTVDANAMADFLGKDFPKN